MLELEHIQFHHIQLPLDILDLLAFWALEVEQVAVPMEDTWMRSASLTILEIGRVDRGICCRRFTVVGISKQAYVILY